MKIQKLDGRHAGVHLFTHYICPTSALPTYGSSYAGDRELLQKWRVWCWEHLGPGCERDYAYQQVLLKTPVKWAWETDRNQCRLYLTDEAMTLFMLKWA